MAMLQLGMGETGVAETGSGEPAVVDKFLGGAKVWLNPGYITTEMTALWAGVKADAVGTLTSPRALGFLLVPAAILAVVLGMKSARARRARNPRRAAVGRRSPRRRVARGRRRNPGKGYFALKDSSGYTVSRHKTSRAAWDAYSRKKGHNRVIYIHPDGTSTPDYDTRTYYPKRRRNAGPRAGKRRLL